MGAMNRESLLPLVGCYVQIKKTDGFLIDGILEKVWDDSISFLGDGKIRVISLQEMAEIRQIDRRQYR
ncbi:MAG: hypothetical protein NTX92_08965 [Euryarchaeota archaeon]|nr:hypothetical protein [Euryarchaeota archaeon]